MPTSGAAAAEPLQSPVWGRRQALGGHGDPTGEAVATMGAIRPNQWAELKREVLGQLADVAQHLPPAGGDPLVRIAAAIPGMSSTAADATRLLANRIDGRLRRKLHLDHDRQFMARVPCPACDVVELMIRTCPPPAQRVLECLTCGRAWALDPDGGERSSVIEVAGEWWGTAREIADHLGHGVTAAMVRWWAAHEGLSQVRIRDGDGRPQVRYLLGEAVVIEAA